jgi:hypothetical protein
MILYLQIKGRPGRMVVGFTTACAYHHLKLCVRPYMEVMYLYSSAIYFFLIYTFQNDYFKLHIFYVVK